MLYVHWLSCCCCCCYSCHSLLSSALNFLCWFFFCSSLSLSLSLLLVVFVFAISFLFVVVGFFSLSLSRFLQQHIKNIERDLCWWLNYCNFHIIQTWLALIRKMFRFVFFFSLCCCCSQIATKSHHQNTFHFKVKIQCALEHSRKCVIDSRNDKYRITKIKRADTHECCKLNFKKVCNNNNQQRKKRATEISLEQIIYWNFIVSLCNESAHEDDDDDDDAISLVGWLAHWLTGWLCVCRIFTYTSPKSKM